MSEEINTLFPFLLIVWEVAISLMYLIVQA
jgi:hypothetical protein